jgi:hypothetical protein
MIHLTVQQLSASLDGALTGPSLELVVRHLAACHECRDRQARLAKHDDALRRLMAQEPSDIFLDDLTRRAEALATAIARGMPAPVMVTSVPLLHEEDPFAPVEPPPLPARPEFGKSGQMALEAGWGRIGMKPSAPPQVPPSDPEEARRMLESLASGTTGDFTELTPQGPESHTPVDGPVFDLPAWIKDQSGTLPRTPGPREVPRLEMFIEDHDEPAAGTTREAANEAFRRDSEPGHPGSGGSARAPGSRDDAAPPAEPGPPAPSAYAPRGWQEDDASSHAGATPAQFGAAEVAVPGRDAAYAPGEPTAYAPAGWQFAPAPPAAPHESAWGAGVGDPGASGSAAWPQAPTGPLAETHPDVYAPRATRSRRAPELDPVAMLALASVAALLLILLVLQLVPAGPRMSARAGSRGPLGGKIPRVEILRHGEQAPAPVAPKPRLRTADTPPPVEQVVPPAVMPTPTDAPELDRRSDPATDAAVAPSAAPPPAATIATASTSHAPAAHPAASTPGSNAHDAATSPAPPGDEVERLLLCGQVTGDAGEPVANARVSMAEIGFATRTDGRGRFCVSAPAGSHALLVESSGFAAQRVPVTFSSSSMDVHIRLQPAR